MICFKIYTILDNEEEINQFLECCGGKFSKACPTQPPSMCHNMTMGMPVSHLIRGWLPDVASTGPASRLNVSTRDFRVDFTPVLSLLCSATFQPRLHSTLLSFTSLDRETFRKTTHKTKTRSMVYFWHCPRTWRTELRLVWLGQWTTRFGPGVRLLPELPSQQSNGLWAC